MYPAELSQSQSFQCQTPNPKMSWSLRKVRQSWLCQSLGSSLIQSNLEWRAESLSWNISYADDLPFNLCAISVPSPVSPVVFTVGSHAGCSNPPLSVPPWQKIAIQRMDVIKDCYLLHPGPAGLTGHHIWEEGFDGVVLGGAPGLIHVHKVSPPGGAEDLSISLGHSLLQTTKVDALDSIINLNLAPAVRTGGSLDYLMI